jgi:hypothetical protein
MERKRCASKASARESSFEKKNAVLRNKNTLFPVKY